MYKTEPLVLQDSKTKQGRLRDRQDYGINKYQEEQERARDRQVHRQDYGIDKYWLLVPALAKQ